MSAIAVQIADDVVSLLNGADAGTFSETFTAERDSLAIVEPEDIKCVRVVILPHPDTEFGFATRGEHDETHGARIVPMKKLTGSCKADRNEQMDALLLLHEEIRDYAIDPSNRILAISQAKLVDVVRILEFNEERLNTEHEFIAETYLKYRIQR